jgi:hypothetical protein
VISARVWRLLEAIVVLQSIEVALRELEKRELSSEDLKYLAYLNSNIARIIQERLRDV